MRRRRQAGAGSALAFTLALACGGLWLAGGSPPAAAQLAEVWAAGSSLDMPGERPSGRLRGMGDMRVAVADEENEIHLLDFARNLAGHLSDKPGSHVDVLAGAGTWKDQTTVELPDQDYQAVPGSFFVNLKPRPGTAIGGGLSYTDATSDRLVTDDLRRVFMLPLEDGVEAPVRDVAFNAGLKVPVVSVHYARQLSRRIALGLGWRYVFQQEVKTTPTLYRIEHDSGTHALRAGLAVDLLPGGGNGALRGLVVGASGSIAQTSIDGTSSDNLHADDYRWERPSVRGSVHAIGELQGGMKAGVDFRYSSFEGQEKAAFNWSQSFFLNPTERTLIFKRATFEEGLRLKGMEARWELRPHSQPFYLGAGFAARQVESWQLPALNVNSYVAAKNMQETSWQAVGGGSYYLPGGRGLVAGELAYGFSDLDQRLSSPTRTAPSSTLELGVGGEYFPYLRLGLRAGFRHIRYDADRDTDDPTLDRRTRRYAGGVAYRTPDGLWQVDAGYTYDAIEKQSTQPGTEDGSRSQFTLQLRWLL